MILRHGGDGLLKFQDAEGVSNVELADAFEQMWQKQSKDSCQDKIEPEDQDLEPLSYAEQFPVPK